MLGLPSLLSTDSASTDPGSPLLPWSPFTSPSPGSASQNLFDRTLEYEKAWPPIPRRRNSAERNSVERLQPLRSSLNSSAAEEDEEDESSSRRDNSEDAKGEGDLSNEREGNPIAPFAYRRNSRSKNPARRIRSLQSSLKSAFDEYSEQFNDMHADFVRGKKDNEELSERNKKLTEELRKAKEQSRKKIQAMEAQLRKVEVVNRDLNKKNKKLNEKFHKARGQYWKRFRDIKSELVTAKLQNKKSDEINHGLRVRLDEKEAGYFTLMKRNDNLEEELNKAKDRETSSKRNLEQTRNKMQELCTTFTVLTEECDQACKQEQTGTAPHHSKKRKYFLKVYEVNDWVNCSICFEPWTESGEHTACSLSCGHFFGRSCITKWISRNQVGGSDSTCPVCLNRTNLSDIRRHYVSQIHNGKEKFEHAD